MTCYIVSFETADEPSRLRVVERLKTYPGFCPIHKHCWAINADKSSKEIVDFVAQGFQANERIFVIRSGTLATWRNSYGEKHDQWLKANL